MLQYRDVITSICSRVMTCLVGEMCSTCPCGRHEAAALSERRVIGRILTDLAHHLVRGLLAGWAVLKHEVMIALY